MVRGMSLLQQYNSIVMSGIAVPPPPPPSSSSSSSLVLTIVSARYGPCKQGNRLSQNRLGAARRQRQRPDGSYGLFVQREQDNHGRRGESRYPVDHDDGDNSNESRRWTRDVTPSLLQCLRESSFAVKETDGARKRNDEVHPSNNATTYEHPDAEPRSCCSTSSRQDCDDEQQQTRRSVRLRSVNQEGYKVTLIPIPLPPRNVAFGDPCPGTTKRLYVEYIVTEEDEDEDEDPTDQQYGPSGSMVRHAASFAEHEPVVLRRHFVRSTSNDSDSAVAAAPSVASKSDPSAALHRRPANGATTGLVATVPATARSSPDDADFTSGSLSDIALPLVLPWMPLRDRLRCQQACRGWRKLVRQWGVATAIDVGSNAAASGDGDGSASSATGAALLTRPALRGLLMHSFASLQSLYVGGMTDLQKADLNPALPYMRRLRAIDLSYCFHLDDETLRVLSRGYDNVDAAIGIRTTLQVLYIKGLRLVTDVGLSCLAEGCRNLRVLDVSGIHGMTDASGALLGSNLQHLRALYFRDNYRITQRTLEALAANCPELEQLALWGCARLEQIPPFSLSATTSPLHRTSQVVLLNLWGCHSLTDEAAQSLRNMSHLRTLIVSECHRLTDQFVLSICQQAPDLHHFILRYCKRITDTGVRAVAHSLRSLYSLDLSYCANVTSSSLAELFLCLPSLSELRLAWCRGLDLVILPDSHRYRHHSVGELGIAGETILKALRRSDCRLSVLDVTACAGAGESSSDEDTELFVSAMESIGFEHCPAGFFSRPVRLG